MSQPTCSNIAVPVSETVYASDASTLNGGLVSTRVPLETSKMFWRSAAKKARNPKLPSRTAALIQQYEDDPEDFGQTLTLRRRFWMLGGLSGYDMASLRVCGGAGVVTKCLVALDVVCGPIFGISYSRKYDITNHRVFAWLAFMCEDDRLRPFWQLHLAQRSVLLLRHGIPGSCTAIVWHFLLWA